MALRPVQDGLAREAATTPRPGWLRVQFRLAVSFGAAAKVTPIRFCWIHTMLHSWIEESLTITRRKCGGTKAGFSTSMAAPSGEIFRTMQLMTDPPDETYAGSFISVRGCFRFSSIDPSLDANSPGDISAKP